MAKQPSPPSTASTRCLRRRSWRIYRAYHPQPFLLNMTLMLAMLAYAFLSGFRCAMPDPAAHHRAPTPPLATLPKRATRAGLNGPALGRRASASFFSFSIMAGREIAVRGDPPRLLPGAERRAACPGRSPRRRARRELKPSAAKARWAVIRSASDNGVSRAGQARTSGPPPRRSDGPPAGPPRQRIGQPASSCCTLRITEVDTGSSRKIGPEAPAGARS